MSPEIGQAWAAPTGPLGFSSPGWAQRGGSSPSGQGQGGQAAHSTPSSSSTREGCSWVTSEAREGTRASSGLSVGLAHLPVTGLSKPLDGDQAKVGKQLTGLVGVGTGKTEKEVRFKFVQGTHMSGVPACLGYPPWATYKLCLKESNDHPQLCITGPLQRPGHYDSQK